MFKSIIRGMVEKKVYYPINTETIAERHQWNYWIFLGWHVLFSIAYIFLVIVIIINIK